ncbi:MAG: hypothetical protein DMG25_09580 [Acidobacteria bacterium]|nr:MAG: hypothetical protein DMG25_09580 [Acidobacteriota bacterium]PYV28312.1 MAG: hypothetical protein DMG27_01550 [Acidobacteriota bacterium]
MSVKPGRKFAKLLAGALTLFMAALAACAQDSTVIPLVPAANWRLVGSQNLDVTAVSRWGGDPAIEREYGVKSIQYRTYQLADKVAGAVEVAGVVLEEASDPSAAYGLLTYYQTERMSPAKGVELTVTSPEGALMARGSVFIRFGRVAGVRLSDDALRAILILVGGTRPSASAMAALPPPLPVSGLVPGSMKYLLGPEAARHVLPSFSTDLIGFEQGAEVEVAHYQVGSIMANPTAGSKATPFLTLVVTLVAITYPTPQIARERFGIMGKTLELNRGRGPQSLYGKRGGSFVFLAMNANSEAAATRLLDQFNVSEQVVRNERYPRNKPVALQMLELILANLLLVFLLVSLALLGGILIALSKRVARKWLPDWEWGSPDGERLTTLNLR